MSEINELESARRLRRAVGELPRELRPGRDLWPEIAGRLEPRPRVGTAGGWWRLAAAVTLVAGGLLAAVVMRPDPAGRPSVAARPQAGGSLLAAAHMRQRDGVVHVHNDLVAAVARRSGHLDEAGAAALARGLADLERATAEIESALVDNPGDRRLRLALAAAYRRESDWTSRIGRV